MADPWRERGSIEKKCIQSQGGKYPYLHVLRSNITTDVCAKSSSYKGGLDMLDDSECNLGDHIYYYFVPDWPDIDVTRSCGWGLRAELSVRAIGEAGDRRGDAIRDLLEGEGITHFRPRFGDRARSIAPSPTLTGSTSAHYNEDCKKDCGLDLQSHVKKWLQVGMQSILGQGLRIWNAIPLKRILMMPDFCIGHVIFLVEVDFP